MNAKRGNDAPTANRSGSLRGFLFLMIGCFALAWTASGLAQDAQLDAAAAEQAYAAQTLRVGVWLDRDEDEVYRRGDEQSVALQTNEDAFAVVYRIDAEGLVTILWPRSRFDDGFIFGGHEYVLPVSGGPRLRVSRQSGEGFVEAIVSRYPFDLRDLEVDFHHEDYDEDFGFQVVGDPFLAMNEVNFAITGLEDSSDFVVTNYVSYYVHQKVDHPRYLCGQCHYDDVASYHPYTTHCTLHITYDYGWYNRWYFRFGYYPVYYYPAYAYYDPWCWRPWINFWYDPWYVFPQVNIYTWPSTVYVWLDSPYYVGNSTVRYKEGNRVYRPLNVRAAGSKPVRASRDLIRTNLMVNRDRPGTRDLEAMRSRRQTAQRPSLLGERGGQVLARGEDRRQRSRPELDTRTSSGRRGGLQIRDDRNPLSSSKPDLRHSAAGNGRDSALKPRDAGQGGGDRPVQRPGARDRTLGGRRGQDAAGDRTDQSGGARTIKPVEPRKKGTRIWKSNSGSQGRSDRQDRSGQVKPRTGGERAPASSSARRSGQRQEQTKPAPAPRKDSGRVKEQPRSSGGRSGGGQVRESKPSPSRSGSQSGVRSGSAPQNRSSGSSTSSSRRGGGSGGSRSGSRSSGGGRGGGTERR